MHITIKKRIMFGVYVLCLVRKLKTPLITESIIFAILAMILFYFVSVSNFFTNMFDSGNFYSYFIMAFSNTNFLIQSILVLAALTTLFFMRNVTLQTVLKERLA